MNNIYIYVYVYVHMYVYVYSLYADRYAQKYIF